MQKVGRPQTGSQTWSSCTTTLPRHTSPFRGAEEIGSLWQVNVVELSLSYDYLLHQILAFSAFHLVHLRPEEHRRYYHSAAQHQRQAVRGMSAALSGLSTTTCHGLFMAASLLAISNFAALTIHAEDQTDDRPTIDDVIDVFNLLRGMNTVLQSWEETIQQGPLYELFRFSTPQSGSFLLRSDINQRLGQLRVLLDAKLSNSVVVASLIERRFWSSPTTCNTPSASRLSRS